MIICAVKSRFTRWIRKSCQARFHRGLLRSWRVTAGEVRFAGKDRSASFFDGVLRIHLGAEQRELLGDDGDGLRRGNRAQQAAFQLPARDTLKGGLL